MPVADHQLPTGDRPNVRVPKLAVRNRSDNSIPLTEQVSPAASVISVISQPSPVQDDTDRRDSGQSGETTRPPHSTRKHQKPSKKDTGVFSFLTLKEPSTSAWGDYAKQQKQQIATGKLGVPKVSMQKLPNHVPKVNSKWDGLPDSTKKSAPRPSQSSRQRPSSTRRSVGEGRSLDSSIPRSRPNGSLTSNPPGVASQDCRQDSVKSTSTSVLNDVDAVLPATHDLVERRHIPAQPTLCPTGSSIKFADANMRASSPTNVLDSSRVSSRPSPPAALPALPSIIHELDSTEIPQLVTYDSSYKLPTSPETSPTTPPDDHSSTLDQGAEPSSGELGPFWLADTAIETPPTTPTKPSASQTPISSPAKSRVMNFSRPSRPLIETFPHGTSSPAQHVDVPNPHSFLPPQTMTSVLQPDGPVELPCPSTLSPIPENNLPRPRIRDGNEGTKRGRFVAMLGRR